MKYVHSEKKILPMLADFFSHRAAAADEIGVCHATVYRWLNGKTSPLLDELAAVATASKVPLEYCTHFFVALSMDIKVLARYDSICERDRNFIIHYRETKRWRDIFNGRIDE